jgi:hypothetical protein
MWRRTLVVVPTLGSLLGLTLVVLPTVHVRGATAPPPVQITSEAVTSATGVVAPGWSRAVSGRTDMVGVTWQGDPGATFSIQRQDDRGRWSDAGEVARPDGGPDVGSREARRARPGNVSEPVWVGNARAVRILVTKGSVRAIGVQKLRVPRAAPTPGVASAAPPQPAIISRAQWGADENLRLTNCPEGPTYDANVELAIVHHTGSSNNYGPGDTPAIMRGLYAYATQTLQYCDMHYNFLVDKYGQVYEGRYGGIAAPVHGAHSVGFNTNTTGIATIGNFQTTPAPPAMLDAVARLIAWKFDVHGVDPTTPITYVTAGNDKFPAGTAVTVPRIIGHQDTWFTDCPGQYIEPLLGPMRATVTAMMAGSRSWHPWGAFTGGVTSAPTAAAWGTNRLDVFAANSGAIVHKWWDGLSWYPGWEDLAPPSGGFTGTPTAISWGPDRIDLFVTAPDHTLRHRWWNGSAWEAWEDLGGGDLTSSPAVASWGTNRLDVFVRGDAGALRHLWWNGTRWQPWETISAGVAGDPAAVSWGFNRIDVFVRGTDDVLYHQWWDGTRWQRFESLGGVLTEAPSAASWQPDRLDVFVRGTGDRLYHKWWDGRQWQGFEYLDGTLTSKPFALSKSWDRVDVFARGLNTGMWQRTWG